MSPVWIETHISRVLLHGARAYKVKKPLRLPFLDFSTPERRHRFGLEELRLNRRTAPDLYLGLRPLSQPWEAFAADPEAALSASVAEQAHDWVLVMRRFAPEALLATQARHGALGPAGVDALAQHVAAFHASLAPGLALPARDCLHWAFECVQALLADAALGAAARAQLEALAPLLLQQLQALQPWQQQRAAHGWVRECHGDLHLGNLIAWEGRVCAFDALEFEPDLRQIDTLHDASFAYMDLHAHGLGALAQRYLNGYLDASGDYEGLHALRPWCAWRALVRARVARLSAPAEPVEAPAPSLQRYLDCASAWLAAPGAPAIWLVQGLSGSGKSSVCSLLRDALAQAKAGGACPAQWALHIRSDLERKRLLGVPATARPRDEERAHWYSAALTELTYARLHTLAAHALSAGFSVLIDACALRRHERDALRTLAQAQGAAFHLWHCQAPAAQAAQRLAQRQQQGQDASDADAAVLAQQQQWAEHIAPDEQDARFRTLHNHADLPDLAQQVQRALL